MIIYQNSYCQNELSTTTITKYIFSNDLKNVEKYSELKDNDDLKGKLDSIEKIKIMYKIDTDSLKIVRKIITTNKSDTIELIKKTSKLRYELSPKYSGMFNASHVVELSYDSYIDKKCDSWSSSACTEKEFDARLTNITIINNYLKKDFDLNTYFEIFFKENKYPQANVLITNKFKNLISSGKYVNNKLPSFIKNLDKLEYQVEEAYQLNNSKDIYTIYFTNGNDENAKYFKIIFNLDDSRMIININEKFYIVKNPKIKSLKKWVLQSFKIK